MVQYTDHKGACHDKAPRGWRQVVSTFRLVGHQQHLWDRDGCCLTTQYEQLRDGSDVRTHTAKDRGNMSLLINLPRCHPAVKQIPHFVRNDKGVRIAVITRHRRERKE